MIPYVSVVSDAAQNASASSEVDVTAPLNRVRLIGDHVLKVEAFVKRLFKQVGNRTESVRTPVSIQPTFSASPPHSTPLVSSQQHSVHCPADNSMRVDLANLQTCTGSLSGSSVAPGKYENLSKLLYEPLRSVKKYGDCMQFSPPNHFGLP